MKLVLMILCFVVAAAYVNGEVCTVNGDCTATTCGSGFHVICQHPPGTGVVSNGGLCTCAANDLSCTTQQDCIDADYNCIDDAHKHCYDGSCICSRW